ncbi:hypothetical protein HDK77DRAFT_506132 [Phyllosticta capitalensis]|uniref:uncharacterized protein n=1 Tax=Phyllosticta capitalensis TaxID=121624 RepID=UPI00312FF7B9
MADQQGNLTVIAPPFEITATDLRGVLVVVASVTLSFVVTCLIIRVYLRSRTKDWRRDDSILALATLCCCCQGAAVFVMIHEGTGMVGVDDANLDRLGTANYAQQTLYLITLFLSKTAVVFLYLRLTVHRKRAIAIYCTFGLIVAWLVVSLVVLGIWCDPKQYWTLGDQCPQNLDWRWDIVGGIDMTTEAILFLIAVSMVVGLQMPLRTKMIIITVFSVRLPLIAASAARLHFIHALANSATPALEIASALVCSQFQLDFAVMTSTICCLGPFLRPFEDDSHASTTTGTLPSHYSGSHAADASLNRTKRRSRVVAAGALGPECGRLGGTDGLGPEWLSCAHHRPRPRRRDTMSNVDGLDDVDDDEVRLCDSSVDRRRSRGDAVPLATLRSATTSPRARGRRKHGHGHGRNASSLSVAAAGARSPPGSGCPSRSMSVASSAQRRTLGLCLGVSVGGGERERETPPLASPSPGLPSASSFNTQNNDSIDTPTRPPQHFSSSSALGLELRPDYFQHTTYAARDEEGPVSVSELDGVSLASGDSQRLIIAKTVVTVDVEEGPAVVGGGWAGTPGALGPQSPTLPQPGARNSRSSLHHGNPNNNTNLYTSDADTEAQQEQRQPSTAAARQEVDETQTRTSWQTTANPNTNANASSPTSLQPGTAF